MELLTRQQYEAAVRLASAHGHEWAWAEEGWSPCFYRSVEGREEVCAVDEITLHTLSRRTPSSIPGIASPELDRHGAIFHQTVTGRLSWRIWPDGVLMLHLYRPAGLVAEVRRVDGRWSAVRLSPSVPFYGRHADALRVALRALDAPEEIIRGVLEWVTPEVTQSRLGGGGGSGELDPD